MTATVSTPACTKTRNIYESEKYLSTLSTSTGTHILQWPVSPTRISAYFNDPGYRAILGADHNAIDIPVPQGTPIYAPADGYISYMLPPTARGYAYFAVRHAGGYTTVYGHVSEISVRPYQFVRTGDYLGKTGGAVGTPGAGPMTSGAHLHYEVYKDQVTVDPLQYMSIAGLPYETLPAKYREKYIADIVAKYGT
jgi:murein DD-endopeptidase MepM/ murein hydrolase activator NlpD